MPPKIKITKSNIVETALHLVQREGTQAINARRIAVELNCSTQPVFSNFSTMEDLRMAVKEAADKMYQSYLHADMTANKYPPYKASGMAYIRFAREQRELFKMLFMYDRSGETVTENREAIRPLLELIQKNLGISGEEAFWFHMELWIYVHGIAAMIATSYLNWDDEVISRLLSDAYTGLKTRFEGRKDHVSN